jgi:propanol-preferring alcohol dehydrogenase
MVLERPRSSLVRRDLDVPEPGRGELRVSITACGVCRTDLHVVDGDLPDPALPLVPGHEIVGLVDAIGEGVDGFQHGQRVGIPWVGRTCGRCVFCRSGRENLCDHPVFTGYTRDGGYAEYAVADARYCFPLPEGPSAAELAPLLCAGLIGYRSYRLAGESRRLGLYGFGAAAHILAQVARADGREIYAFTKPGDEAGQAFARRLGAAWAGGSDESPPELLDAAILFAPVGDLVPAALRAVQKGGRVVCAGIHMSRIPAFDYRILWEERSIVSVANLTRADGEEFFATVARQPVTTSVETFPLDAANEALERLRAGRIEGAGVLTVREEI